MNGNRLKERRQAAQFTQESLGEILNTNARQIWRWEAGETQPSAEMLGKIARALRTSADYFLDLTDDPSPSVVKFSDMSDQEHYLINSIRRGDLAAALRKILDIMER